jgi:hypothetical protein
LSKYIKFICNTFIWDLIVEFYRAIKIKLVELQYPQLGHYNVVFNNHKVIGFGREVGSKENEATYMIYCNNMHHHCLGGDLVCRYIGR